MHGFPSSLTIKKSRGNLIAKVINRNVKLFTLLKHERDYPLDIFGWHRRSNLQGPKSNCREINLVPIISFAMHGKDGTQVG